jgi:energy-converting hydrogenase B subunit D
MEALAATVSLASLVVVAITALVSRNLLVSVILMSVFSLISALLFYLCDAPDVAITEAAVGAGVSTLIYVWAIHHTRDGERK